METKVSSDWLGYLDQVQTVPSDWLGYLDQVQTVPSDWLGYLDQVQTVPSVVNTLINSQNLFKLT